MGRSGKIAIGLVVVLALLLGLNALVTGAETKSAEVTRPDGRILELRGGDVQVVDSGPGEGPSMVLIHCFTCASDWWDGMINRLGRGNHRVVAVDLLGHGGSEKPESGYSIESQAALVAEALSRLGVSDATVVGHSLGGTVAVALAERSPELVDRLVIIGTAPSHEEGDLGLLANLAFTPVIGEALWRISPDAAVREGLGVAFAPGYEVPDAFVEDVNRMTYSAYDQSASASEDFGEEMPLDRRLAAVGKPLLAIMGSEEQIVDDPEAALAQYAKSVDRAQTELIPGAGHSPNVEKPVVTTGLILAFAAPAVREAARKARVQRRLQDRGAVRGQP